MIGLLASSVIQIKDSVKILIPKMTTENTIIELCSKKFWFAEQQEKAIYGPGYRPLLTRINDDTVLNKAHI